MATLAGFRGTDVVPDLSQGFANIDQFFSDRKQIGLEKESKQLAEDLSDPNITPAEEDAKLIRLQAINPKLAEFTKQIIDRGDLRELEANNVELLERNRRATGFASITDDVAQKKAILAKAKEIQDNNGDPEVVDRLVALAGIENFAERQNKIQQQIISTQDAKGLGATRVAQKKAEEKKKVETIANNSRDAANILAQPDVQLRQAVVERHKRALREKDEAAIEFTRRLMENPDINAVRRELKGVMNLGRKPGDVAENFDDIIDDKGNIIGKRNTLTNEAEFFSGAFGGGKGRPTKGQSFRVVDKKGNVTIRTVEFDPNKPPGKRTTLSSVPLGEGELVSPLGETPEEQEARKLEARKEAAKVDIEKAGDLSTQEKKIKRDEDSIDAAQLAAEAVPQIKQSLKLLKEIETGFTGGAELFVRQKLGIETADEAELAFNLRKNVLKQLKPTFGAAFTVTEAQKLEDIEAATTKSTAGNIRLLRRGLQIYDRVIDRGLRAAKRRGDTAAVEDIEAARAELAVLEDATARIPTPESAADKVKKSETAQQRLRREESESLGQGTFELNEETGEFEKVQ